MNHLILGVLACGVFYTLFFVGCALIAHSMPTLWFANKAEVALTWLPPFIRGEDLRRWAASAAAQFAERYLSEGHSAATAKQLIAEMEEGAMRAMLPTTDPAELNRIIACPDRGQGLIGVTAPEAFAIADSIRKNLRRAEQNRILELATDNEKKLASGTLMKIDPLSLQCPLQGKDRACCAYGARPLRCRPLHALTIAKATGTQIADAGEYVEGCLHIYTVAEGVEAGFTEALRLAHLDSNVYELNSALVTVLSTPGAAELWAKGEDVFVGCNRIDHAAQVE